MRDDPAETGALGRRSLLAGVVGSLGAGPLGWTYTSRHVEVPLHAETVAFDGGGRRVAVTRDTLGRLVPGSRVLDGPGAQARLAHETQWLERASLDTSDELAKGAAQDLYVLTEGLPASVAGWSPKWRYAWPRDTAHVAVALHGLGRADLARRQLEFLARVQGRDGTFEARYDPWTLKAPDARPPQLDGCGWFLWAAATVAGRDQAWLGRHRRPVTAAIDAAIGCLDRHGSPPASPDYWEVEAARVNLGTAAVLLAGLDHGVDLAGALGDTALATKTHAAHERLAAFVSRGFAAADYPRDVGSDATDAAVAFLSPTYQRRFAAPHLAEALRRYEREAARPAGGVAPGAGWKNDGISWTPEVALLANAYGACGLTADRDRLLSWLREHRTSAGSLPEKVLHDGRPAAVAPLAWTAASVLMALERGR